MTKYDIDVIRHSTAHVMAQAISRLFPNELVKFGIGPTVENGFYYDIDMNTKILDDDLPKIEEEMKKIIKEKIPVVKTIFKTKLEAIEFFKQKKQDLRYSRIPVPYSDS